MNTTALIADDERLMREQLATRLTQAWPELQIVAQARNGQEAVALTQSHHPDVVFLDIRMPVLTGIEAARQIAQLPTHDEADGWPGCELVFITAYDQYAVEAFEHGALDYMLKPADPQRLGRCVQRVQQRLTQRAQAGADAVEPLTMHTPHLQQVLQTLASQGVAVRPPLQWIQASVRGAIEMIAVEDVLFFISDEKYTRVQTARGEALIRKPIKELVEELDMRCFWQIHRSTLVNVSAIASVTRDDRGRQLVSINGSSEKLEVSRSYAGLFRGM